ncbi:MAG: hypothetical protein VKJ04_10345 [Vampirovibrionales bacterium]|nr:hypothetical protein [Vampirovibrionales bacterium]
MMTPTSLSAISQNGLTPYMPVAPFAQGHSQQSGLAEQVLKTTRLPLLNLRALEAIQGRDSGNEETLALLRAKLLENPLSLAPLQQLDANFLRLKAARALVELANNPNFEAARGTLSGVAQTVLARPFDDVNVKVELLYGLKSAGINKGIDASAVSPEVSAKLQERIALAQREQGVVAQTAPHHTASSAIFQVYA